MTAEEASLAICKIVEAALLESGIVTTIHYEVKYQDQIKAVIEALVEEGS